MGKKAKICICTGILLFLAGAAAFVCGFALLDFKPENLNTHTVRSETYAAQEDFDTVRLQFPDADIRVEFSETAENISLSYPEKYDRKDKAVTETTITAEGKTLCVKQTALWYKMLFNVSFTRGSAVLTLPANKVYHLELDADNGTIELPAGAYGSVSLETDNGAIRVNGIETQTLRIETDNGAISAENVAAETIGLETDNGKIIMNNITANAVSASTDNGDIELTRLTANDIRLSTANGDVAGTVCGKVSEYKIDASTHNGRCNLQPSESGEKFLRAKSNNGNIEIAFTE